MSILFSLYNTIMTQRRALTPLEINRVFGGEYSPYSRGQVQSLHRVGLGPRSLAKTLNKEYRSTVNRRTFPFRHHKSYRRPHPSRRATWVFDAAHPRSPAVTLPPSPSPTALTRLTHFARLDQSASTFFALPFSTTPWISFGLPASQIAGP